MRAHRQPTIFAPATAVARQGVAVVRISGPSAFDVLRHCVYGGNADITPRTAHLRRLVHPETGDVIDQVLVLTFPAPNSFTGEDVVELHTHGGRAIMRAVVEALSALPGFRMAEAGEFTRRAFENDKMDLTEAEAIADLIHAETEQQRRQAVRQMDGALGKLYDGWRETLTRLLAYVEAAIDFADDDLPDDVMAVQMAEVPRLIERIRAHLDDHKRGERLREGFAVAIIGAPNAGKSSLLNALTKRDVAIVSDVAGTTRDVIEVALDLGGYPVVLADTAGLRESLDNIEHEGIRRAYQRAEQADLKLAVYDGATWPVCDASTDSLCDAQTIKILNKHDVLPAGAESAAVAAGFHVISTQTGYGVEGILAKLRDHVEQVMGGASNDPCLTRARHRTALEDCVDHLSRAMAAPYVDQRAEDIRLATRSLGRITGRVDVEDLLDIIFRDFCIGK